MVTSIPLNPQRQQKFKELVQQQEEAAGGRQRLRSAKLAVKGEVSAAPIYRFELTDLAYNKSNGRIKAEVSEKEAQMGRTLNQFDENDGKIIGEILLSIRRDENDKIRADLDKNGQINPGIVTADGIVINGNRRKALLSELYEKTHEEKFKYLEAHTLPPNLKKSELWLIEAGIQLSAPQQLDYSPINNLLKLREGSNSGLTIAEMASRIYGKDEEEIQSDLDRLDLIDEYLTDFLGNKEKYFLVRGLDNHFINLQNILTFYLKSKGKMDWVSTKDDINELKLVSFYFIRMHMPHLRIRDIKDLFRLEKSWQQLKRALAVELSLSEEEKAKYKLGEPVDETSDDDDEFVDSDIDKADDGIETSSEIQCKREDAIWRENRTAELKSIFQDAREQKEIQDDSSKPLTLAKRALNNIQGIPENEEQLNDPTIDTILSEIITRVNLLRKLIKTSHKK